MVEEGAQRVVEATEIVEEDAEFSMSRLGRAQREARYHIGQKVMQIRSSVSYQCGISQSRDNFNNHEVVYCSTTNSEKTALPLAEIDRREMDRLKVNRDNLESYNIHRNKQGDGITEEEEEDFDQEVTKNCGVFDRKAALIFINFNNCGGLDIASETDFFNLRQNLDQSSGEESSDKE